MNLVIIYLVLSYFIVPLAITVHREWRSVFRKTTPLFAFLMILVLLVWPVLIVVVLSKIFIADKGEETLI